MVSKLKNIFLFLIIFNLHSEDLVEEGKTVESDQSMVVTRHHLASRAGNEILMNGKLGELFPVGNYRVLASKLLSFSKNKNILICKVFHFLFIALYFIILKNQGDFIIY